MYKTNPLHSHLDKCTEKARMDVVKCKHGEAWEGVVNDNALFHLFLCI